LDPVALIENAAIQACNRSLGLGTGVFFDKGEKPLERMGLVAGLAAGEEENSGPIAATIFQAGGLF